MSVKHSGFLRITIAIVLLIVSFYIVLATMTGEGFVRGDKPGSYWLEIYKKEIALSPFLLFASPIGLVLFAVLLGLLMWRKLLVEGVAIAVVAGTLWYAFMCSLVASSLFLTTTRHIETYRLDGYTYHFAERVKQITIVADLCQYRGPDCISGDFDHDYMVFQCDGSGLFCRSVYYERRSDEQLFPAHASLEYDEGAGQLSLVIAGQTVWANEN